ncbi:hypothetical protein KXS11_17740 [Plantibacter flavus]|uniref:hypothetical protein n=1 Tax=Plantibacter flavus TaxID=150123 RepID=UPI003F14FC88
MSAFPAGATCDSLVGAEERTALLGEAAALTPPTIADIALLQDGGIVCAWRTASSEASLSVRLVGDGVDHWASFNHWYEHTDWSSAVGEINGTQCAGDGCSVHALDGERFLEVDATSPGGIVGEQVEAVARAVLATAPAPQPVGRASTAPGTRSCSAALDEAAAVELLGEPSTAAGYVSTATPSYRLADDSFRRLDAVDCRLRSDDGRELLRYTILRGGAWVFREDSPIAPTGEALAVPDPLDRVVVLDEGREAQAQRGADWFRVSAPNVSEGVLLDLLARLAGL